jgi:hypothetical protein
MMVTGNTLFIVGAGASKSFGFPLGWELNEKIHNGFYERLYRDFIEHTTISDSEKQRYLSEANKLAIHVKYATNKSIDYFLSNNEQYLELGKEAISLIMLAHEAESKRDSFSIDSAHDWLTVLFQKCMENILYANEHKRDKISFLTFNYDRSIEYFLHKKLIHSFTQVSKHELETSLRTISIDHVYGKIGRLEWQRESNVGELGYGWDHRNILLPSIRDAVRVMYTERVSGNPVSDLENPIQSADRIFFLGFAYDSDNLQIIDFVNEINQSKGKEIFGTALGIHDNMLNEIRELCGNKHKVILRKDMNCKDLISEYL